jgi:class 3 adenylate cyclase
MHDLRTWLDSVGLAACGDVLEQHDVDLDILAALSDSDLERMGLSLGQRRKLMRAAAARAGGAADAKRAERRQITVIFCDLAGSTALSARLDPEELRDIINPCLKQMTQCIARFGGHVARYMGDGVMAYFGWPLAHEDAAEQAVRAGLAVVEAVRLGCGPGVRLDVRVGVATGLAVVGDVIGAGEAQEHAVVGEVPNLAARLQGAAEINTVLIGPKTQLLLGHVFELEPTGPLTLKGLGAPVTAWRVLGERDAESRFMALRGHSSMNDDLALFDRHDDLALLDRLWVQATLGNGQVVLLTGEAGIGKTRVVEAFGDSKGGEPHLRLRFQCLPHHASIALHPVIRTIGRSAGFAASDSDGERIEKLRRLLARAGDVSEEVVTGLSQALSLGEAPPPLREDEARQRKARLLAALADYFSALAAHQPVLLQIEDTHWIDPTSLDLFDRIASRAAATRLMLVATSRDATDSLFKQAPQATRRAIGRLGREDSARMISRTAGASKLPPDLSNRVLERSDGIPLFIEELTKAVLESVLPAMGSAEGAAAARARPAIVPATLQDSLSARLDRLGWVKHVAQTAAAIGRDFSKTLLAEVAGLPPARLADALQQLCTAELMLQSAPAPQERYMFKHALIQDAAYASLLLSERRVLHAAVAASLINPRGHHADVPPELLAHHFTEAGDPEQAVTWWHRAGRRSIQAAAYLEAVDQLTWCLAELEKLPQTAERDRLESAIRVDLGVPLISLHGYTSEALKHNVQREAILHERTKGILQFPSIAGQAAVAFASSDILTAEALAGQFLAAAERRRDRQLRVVGHWLTGMTQSGAGKFGSSLTHLERALALIDEAQDRGLSTIYGLEPQVAAHSHLAVVLQQCGLAARARDSDRLSVEHGQRCGYPTTHSYALMLRVCLHLLRRDEAALASAAGDLNALARRQSSPLPEAVSGAVLDLLQADAAPDETLFGRIAATLDNVHAAGWNALFGWVGLFEARICLRHRRTDPAGHRLDRLREIMEPRGHHLFLPEILRLQAERARQAGDAPPVSEALLRRSLAMARHQGARIAELRAAMDLACLLRDGGAAGPARDLLAPICNGFSEETGTEDLFQAGLLLKTLG